jgi:hypothetical protein
MKFGTSQSYYKLLKHFNLVKNQTTIMPVNLTGQDICTDTWEDNIKRGFKATGHQWNALVNMLLK